MVSGKKQAINTSLLIMFLLFLMIVPPLLLGLGAGGFSVREVFDQWSFYVGPGGLLLVVCFIAVVVQLWIKEGDNKYGNGISLASNGEPPAIPFFKRFTTLQLILYSLILFSFLGLIGQLTEQTAFTGVGSLEQSFTPGQALLFSTFLIVIAENAGIMALFAIIIVTSRYFARKFDWSKATYLGVVALSTLSTSGLYGLINHKLRYGFNEISLFKVFMFWEVGGIITLLSGSGIPFLILHGVNNAVIAFKEFFTNEFGLAVWIVTLIISITLTLLIYNGRLLGEKRANE